MSSGENSHPGVGMSKEFFTQSAKSVDAVGNGKPLGASVSGNSFSDLDGLLSVSGNHLDDVCNGLMSIFHQFLFVDIGF